MRTIAKPICARLFVWSLSLLTFTYLTLSGSPAAGYKVHGVTVENFSISGERDLSFCHDDFLLFCLGHFKTSDILWHKDNDVKRWIFHKDYDSWAGQGLDSANIGFVSTHGTTIGNNFYLAMGDYWLPQTASIPGYANSENFYLGDDSLRYLFLASCDSIKTDRVSAVWGKRIYGTRMMFGFDTPALDSPLYGHYFWDELDRGEPFSDAWLDASYRVSRHQNPVAVASGSTAEDAQNILNNEKNFYEQKAGDKWFAYCWYESLSASGLPLDLDASQISSQNLFPKKALQGASAFKPSHLDDQKLVELLNSLDGNEYTVTPGQLGQTRTSLINQKYGKTGKEMAYLSSEMHLGLSASQSARQALESASQYVDLIEESNMVSDLYLKDISITYQGLSSKDDPGSYQAGIKDINLEYGMMIGGIPVVGADTLGTINFTYDWSGGQLIEISNNLCEITLLDGTADLKSNGDNAEHATNLMELARQEHGYLSDGIEILNETVEYGYFIDGETARPAVLFESVSPRGVRLSTKHLF